MKRGLLNVAGARLRGTLTSLVIVGGCCGDASLVQHASKVLQSI